MEPEPPQKKTGPAVEREDKTGPSIDTLGGEWSQKYKQEFTKGKSLPSSGGFRVDLEPPSLHKLDNIRQ